MRKCGETKIRDDSKFVENAVGDGISQIGHRCKKMGRIYRLGAIDTTFFCNLFKRFYRSFGFRDDAVRQFGVFHHRIVGFRDILVGNAERFKYRRSFARRGKVGKQKVKRRERTVHPFCIVQSLAVKRN